MVWETDIVIIGAGAAGIGALRGLAGSGLSAVMVEALPRLGGRAWTCKAAGVALDLGCGYLHSAERNPWVAIAEAAGIPVDRTLPAWNMDQPPAGPRAADLAAANAAFERWATRLHGPRPESDCASDLYAPEDARWVSHIQAVSGYVSGDAPERLSIEDLAAYDAAASDQNWCLPGGYGALVAAGLPAGAQVELETPVKAVACTVSGVSVETPRGTLRARAAIVTVPTNALAGDAIAWPAGLAPWRAAAADLPLGRDEKLYFEILEEGAFPLEAHMPGDLDDPLTGAFYFRPQGKPVVECFLGGEGARRAHAEGPAAAYDRALAQIAALMGADAPRRLRPLMASDWGGTASIGGGYSYARPGRAGARAQLAQPYEDRLFFGGEATHPSDFSTAHGALLTGLRAAEEARAALA